MAAMSGGDTSPELVIEDAIWSTLEAQEYPMGGPYVDRDMSMIDSSGSEVDMAAAAKAVLGALRAAGFAVTKLPDVDDDHPEVIAPSWSVREEPGQPMRIQSATARNGVVELECEAKFQVLPPSEARNLAAALLAAAAAVGDVRGER